MADGFFQNDETHQLKIIEAIRKYRPEIILCNSTEDRHPDHGRSAQLVEDAAFLSGLRKIETSYQGGKQQEWRPKYVFHYLQDRFLQPDFVFDISDFIEDKLRSVLCYKTHFTIQTLMNLKHTYRALIFLMPLKPSNDAGKKNWREICRRIYY
jgi:LmbE family N-acetylglucosaminyl deacetylase